MLPSRTKGGNLVHQHVASVRKPTRWCPPNEWGRLPHGWFIGIPPGYGWRPFPQVVCRHPGGMCPKILWGKFVLPPFPTPPPTLVSAIAHVEKEVSCGRQHRRRQIICTTELKTTCDLKKLVCFRALNVSAFPSAGSPIKALHWHQRRRLCESADESLLHPALYSRVDQEMCRLAPGAHNQKHESTFICVWENASVGEALSIAGECVSLLFPADGLISVDSL